MVKILILTLLTLVISFLLSSHYYMSSQNSLGFYHNFCFSLSSACFTVFWFSFHLPTFWTQLTIEILSSFNFHGKFSLPSFPSSLFTHYILFFSFFFFSHTLILVFLKALFSIFISYLYINSSLEISTILCLTLMTPRVLSFCNLSKSKFQLFVRYYLVDILQMTKTQIYLKSITFYIPVLLFCIYYLS